MNSPTNTAIGPTYMTIAWTETLGETAINGRDEPIFYQVEWLNSGGTTALSSSNLDSNTGPYGMS
jgi:hypothetical protein